MSRSVKPIGPTFLILGRKYKALHGGTFECVATASEGRKATIRSITSGATFKISGITEYEDGSITWTGAEDLHYTTKEGARK